MPDRPRLTPAMADVRRAVRECWDAFAAGEPVAPAPREGLAEGDIVLVACSGGADSMALAEAVAFEAPRWGAGLRFGAVIVEHGLQPETKAVAAETASVLRAKGFDPVFVESVDSSAIRSSSSGTEAAARDARYRAFEKLAASSGAKAVMLAHTLDDQAETVLLGLARGSGPRSMAGMRAIASQPGYAYLRPLLRITRETTVAACRDAGVKFWDDPMNLDPSFARVRVRQNVLPLLEEQLGPGIADALSRTADIAREDSDYLDALCNDIFKGTTDLVVCDGFVGNVALKASEGLATMVGQSLKLAFNQNWLTRCVALLAMPVLKDFKHRVDHRRHNGAALLGLTGLVFKSHGSADALAFETALLRAYDACQHGLLRQVQQRLEEAAPLIQAFHDRPSVSTPTTS